MIDAKFQPLVFVRDDSGELTVREWFPYTAMSPEFMGISDDTETVVTFRVSNGTRRYRVLDYDRDGSGVFLLELLQEAA